MTRVACVLFVILAVVHTWPFVTVLGSHATDYNDFVLNVWQLGAIAQQLVRDPLHPLDVNMFYPFKQSLALLDPQLITGVLAAPVTLLSGNPTLGHNVFIFASFVLSGLTMFLLVRALTGSAGAALVAGCIFAFAPFRTERLSHSHMLAGFWLPLMLFWLHRFVAQPRWAHVLAASACFVALSMSSWYFAAIGGVAALIVGGVGIAATPDRARKLARGLVGGALAALVLLPLALPFAWVKSWEVGAMHGAHPEPGATGQGLGTQVRGLLNPQLDISGRANASSELQHYASAGSGSRIWTPMRRFAFVEGSFFPGALALALAAVGLLTIRSTAAQGPRSAQWWHSAWIPLAVAAAVPVAAIVCIALGRPEAWPVLLTRQFSLVVVALLATAGVAFRRVLQSGAGTPAGMGWTYVVLMCAGAILSFGPQVRALGVDLGPSLYPAAIPPFGVLRVPARFGVLVTIGLAVLAGFGLAQVERQLAGRIRWTALSASLIVVNAELLVAPLTFYPVPRVSPADSWLRTAPDGAVVVFPVHDNPWALLNSLFHRKPIVNGSGLVPPPPFVRLNARDDLSPEMIEHLRTYFHPRYAVLNLDRYPSMWRPELDRIIEEGRDDLRQVAQMGATRIFELTPGSRGPRVRRWFPAWMTQGKKGITFTGHAAGMRPDLEAVVTLTIDGRAVTHWPAHSLASAVRQFVPFPPGRRGAITVELAADYALTDSARPQIGTTGVRSPAAVSLAAGPTRTVLQANNQTWSGDKGYTLVTLHPDRQADVRTFNTSWYEEESQALAEYVSRIPRSRIVLLASHYDVSRHLTGNAVEALHTLGFKEDLRGRTHAAHAGVGVKGAAPGTAVECTGADIAECGVGRVAEVALKLSDFRVY